MEEIGNFENETVIGVLIRGKELVNELKNQLLPISVSTEACDNLVEGIISSYENALQLLDYMSQLGNDEILQIRSDNSIEGSLRSEGSDQDSKDQVHKSKKRKISPKWSEQVRISCGAGFEGQLDDGYNWRKYGQKSILGTNHPRAYYRCTHRNTQGCLATKQVQRADDEPKIFEVIYRGKHSCMQEKLRQNKENPIVLKEEQEWSQSHSQQMMITIETNLKPKTQEIVTKEKHFPSFSFPSTPIESENLKAQFFSEPENFITTNYSSPFLSPATSESYFSLSPCPVNDFGIGHSLQSSESDFAEIISNPTLVTNFQFDDLDFLIDHIDFDSHFLDDYFL